MLNHYLQAQDILINSAQNFAAGCDPETRGWAWKPFRPSLESLLAGGRVKRALGATIIIGVALLVFMPVAFAISIWGIVGSLLIFLRLAREYGALASIALAIANFTLCAVVLGYLVHGFAWDKDERDVFGGASWADDIEAISRAGLKGNTRL